MKITARNLLNLTIELLCVVIALSTVLCTVPAFATEITDTDVSEEVEDIPETVSIVVAAGDIRQGDRISNEDLAVKEVPNINLPDNILGSTDNIVGKFVKETIYEGEYVNSALITTDTVMKVNEDVLVRPIRESKSDFLIVTDYIRANTGLEIEYYLQQLIDENPNRTLYFPAGEYVLGSPIATPCDAKYSVSLLLDDGAVIKAADGWRANGEWDALICLGGTKFKNDIYTPGSYYQLQGGILDCRDQTTGVAIEGGRETVVRNICIKNAKTGINVRKATNNTSSDCDFEDITIIGTNKVGSIGINNQASDNSFHDIKIYDMQIGVSSGRGGHAKDIYIFNTHPEKLYTGTVGVASGVTFMSNCYVENCETAYLNIRGDIWDCTAAWTSDHCKKQTAFGRTSGGFMALVGCKAIFHDVEGAKTAFISGSYKEPSCIAGSAFDTSLVTDDSYKKLVGADKGIVWN